MSKGEYIREMSDLQVLNKARNLAVYTLSVTDNDKNFPKKHWKSFLQPMNMEARGITILISMANSIYVTTRHEFWIRNGLQTIALALTYALAESIELAHIKFKVSDKRVKYWIGLLYETRTSSIYTIAMNKSVISSPKNWNWYCQRKRHRLLQLRNLSTF